MAGVTSVVIDGTTYLVDDINAVDFSEDQGLNETQKQQGRSNIGAAALAALAGKADKADLDALEGTVGDLSDDVDGLTEALADKASAIVDTASGAIASFPDGAAVAAKDITIGIEPVQAGSGDPSPDNVRPISGWTGANVTRTGKNLLQTTLTSTVVQGVTYTVNTDGTISLSGTATAPYSQVTVGKISLAAGSYLISDGGNGSENIEMYISGLFQASTKLSGYFVLNEAITNINVYLFVKGGTNVTGKVIKPMICLASAPNPTIFAPYTGTTFPISWQSIAGTVYGGTLDVTTGVLTVDKIGINILITSIYNRPGNDSVSFGVFSLPYAWSVPVDIICEKGFYVGTYDTTIYGGIAIFDTSARKMAICCPRNYTVEECKAFFGDCMFVYELATPQTYQLSPTEVTLLLGVNNVWADTGDTTVTYRADTKLYIQKINTPSDDDMIADAQIASGKYFIVGGNLYRSTTTIPAGDTITPGNNCILTNLADALNALNT